MNVLILNITHSFEGIIFLNALTFLKRKMYSEIKKWNRAVVSCSQLLGKTLKLKYPLTFMLGKFFLSLNPNTNKKVEKLALKIDVCILSVTLCLCLNNYIIHFFPKFLYLYLNSYVWANAFERLTFNVFIVYYFTLLLCYKK